MFYSFVQLCISLFLSIAALAIEVFPLYNLANWLLFIIMMPSFMALVNALKQAALPPTSTYQLCGAIKWANYR